MRCAAKNSPYSITERMVSELIQVLRSQPAGGTGLCSYRVRGVDGSCAEHLTVESYTIIISLQSYLLLFGIPSPTHSFITGLKPSFSANLSHCSPSFFFFNIHYMGLFTVISEHICFLLLVFLFLHFLVVSSLR